MRNMLRFILLAGFLVASCQESEEVNGPLIGKKLFETFNVEIWDDTNRAVFDYPITITTQCKPVMAGKGRIGLQVICGGTPKFAIEYPLQDTIHADTTIYIPVDFVADAPFEQQWIIRLLEDQWSYGFDARAVFDSLFVADSSRYFHIESDEVKAALGAIDFGEASNFKRLWLNYP